MSRYIIYKILAFIRPCREFSEKTYSNCLISKVQLAMLATSVWPHSLVSIMGPSAPCKRLLLVLTSPHCHIKTDAYSVFYRTSICSDYSKAMLPHITHILLKIFKFKLLPFLLYIPPNFLFYYMKPILYSPL